MDTGTLKKFAQTARRDIRKQVGAKLDQVLKTDSVEIREQEQAVKELNEQIKQTSKEAVIDKVSYIWFNRFCALRFMDANRYTRIGTVSPAEGFTQPEILQEAKQGHIDDSLDSFIDRQRVFDLLSGSIPSSDPQQEAYSLLLVAVCNFYNSSMPFLFEKIADYTELLMPDDLLSEGSVLTATLHAMTSDACEDVEVIGWLYQFYISEKKDEVFDGLKKNKKITPENIPAATQLFTPHWIVRYLVENSLGRLWMLNRPESRLIEQMDYYIKPEELEKDFLRIKSPEEIKICDPACGSGHMLVYAFDLLYAIYEEEGYEPSEISEKILTNNLYGIEIDERAGELAAFALTMKARSKYRRFFRRPIQPKICVLENVQFSEGELKEYMNFVGRDLFTEPLLKTLHQFEEADNFGSLIRPEVTDVTYILELLDTKQVASNLFLSATHQKVIQVLQQANYLNPKYHIVIANPPYIGSSGMNGELSAWIRSNYPDSKGNLYATFIERNIDLVTSKGLIAMITMQGWMFLSLFEKMRLKVLENETILSMIHLGARAFDTIGGEIVSTTAFVIINSKRLELNGSYLRLTRGSSEFEKESELRSHKHTPFLASASDFNKIPGSPIAYWIGKKIFDSFAYPKLGELCEGEGKNVTANNDRFLRMTWEVSAQKIGPDKKWLVYSKGGAFRKWSGNLDHVIDWSDNARNYYRVNHSSRIIDSIFWYRRGITWTDITSTGNGFRYLPPDTTYDTTGISIFLRDNSQLYSILALLNSKFSNNILPVLNPTLHANLADIKAIPVSPNVPDCEGLAKACIEIAHKDWNSYETSMGFRKLPLLCPDFVQAEVVNAYQTLRAQWKKNISDLQKFEEENNRIFNNIYDLEDELSSDVALKDITLTCNPHYRYGNDKREEELEALLLADTMKEFISYSVGCMLGRYSLDNPGLILANQGETIQDYLKKIPDPTFPADDDNVIPILDGDWFTDDISERFRKFLRVTFGDEHYEENLKFIENAIGKDIRKYFTRDFYNDHIKRYKKRPIYWLFSSPQGSFNALIYMHRYRPDTISVILNDYLREFRTKLTARVDHLEQISISASASQGEKTKAIKDIEKLNKTIDELETWERDVLYPMATQQIEIDLDDGVKVNYNKFGKALKKVTGLSQ